MKRLSKENGGSDTCIKWEREHIVAIDGFLSVVKRSVNLYFVGLRAVKHFVTTAMCILMNERDTRTNSHRTVSAHVHALRQMDTITDCCLVCDLRKCRCSCELYLFRITNPQGVIRSTLKVKIFEAIYLSCSVRITPRTSNVLMISCRAAIIINI